MDPYPCGMSGARFLRIFGGHPAYGLALPHGGYDPRMRKLIRMTWVGIIVLLYFPFVRLAAVIGHVHAMQHVVGEEKFTVGGHHHDLQLVG